MFCSKCGASNEATSNFCTACGAIMKVTSSTSSNQKEVQKNIDAKPNSEKSTLSVLAIMVAAWTIYWGLWDVGQIADGSGAYITNEEIALLLVLAVTSLALSIPAKVMRMKYSVAALALSIGSFFVMMSAAGYAG